MSPQRVTQRIRREYYIRAVLPNLVMQSRQKFGTASGEYFQELRRSTLSFVESNHLPEHGVGAYSYVVGGPPLLYASCYAALTRHLYGDLNTLSTQEMDEWISYIQRHQRDDGLFRDDLIDCPAADQLDSWGWRHLTLHALMALSALGGTAQKPFQLIQVFQKPGRMKEWLESRNWKNNACEVSNEVQNYGTMLQYARDFQQETRCGDALNEMYEWLDEHQDDRTGCWGYDGSSKLNLSLSVMTGYHLWCLYFYDKRPVHGLEQIIDTCLATQNRLGGFGVGLNSSACEDIDSIDPLVRISFLTEYRRQDVESALKRALIWVITNMNADCGWVFKRAQAFPYGNNNMMVSGFNQSAMFPTWFRTLSLAYLAQTMPENPISNLPWQFLECPGHQFWR